MQMMAHKTKKKGMGPSPKVDVGPSPKVAREIIAKTSKKKRSEYSKSHHNPGY